MEVTIESVTNLIDDQIIKKYNKEKPEEEQIKEMIPLFINKSGTSYNILKIQPKEEIHYSRKTGLYSSERNNSIQKFNSFFEYAKNEGGTFSLVLTPEYSVPVESIKHFIKNSKSLITTGTLYCLCCEGVKMSAIEDILQTAEENNMVAMRKYANRIIGSSIVCCLLYIFRIRFICNNDDKFEKVVVLPQFKTTHMKDVDMQFEASAVEFGHQIFYFGEKNEPKFASIICADIFDRELLKKLSEESKENNFIIFHPQLNMKPQHNLFRFMRSYLFEFCEKNSIRLITLNWAKGTKLVSDDHDYPAMELKHPWSAANFAYDSKDFDAYMSIISKYKSYDLEFTYIHGIGIISFSEEESIANYEIGTFDTPGVARSTDSTCNIT